MRELYFFYLLHYPKRVQRKKYLSKKPKGFQTTNRWNHFKIPNKFIDQLSIWFGKKRLVTSAAVLFISYIPRTIRWMAHIILHTFDRVCFAVLWMVCISDIWYSWCWLNVFVGECGNKYVLVPISLMLSILKNSSMHYSVKWIYFEFILLNVDRED